MLELWEAVMLKCDFPKTGFFKPGNQRTQIYLKILTTALEL